MSGHARLGLDLSRLLMAHFVLVVKDGWSHWTRPLKHELAMHSTPATMMKLASLLLKLNASSGISSKL